MSYVDTKLMLAAVALAEELSFSRAAQRLNIGQSAFSKQIATLEELLGYELFTRNTRTVNLTLAGEVFVEECRLSLLHQERAVQLAREADRKTAYTLHVGKSPYTDPLLLSAALSVELPLHPDLKIHLTSNFTLELRHDLLAGSIDIAFLTGLPPTPQISATPVSTQPFYVAMPEGHPLALRHEVGASDLKEHSCILFERRVHPYLYDKILRLCHPATLSGTAIHHVLTEEEAANLIRRRLGIAILTQAGGWRIARNGITIRPLRVGGLAVQTFIASRSSDLNPTVGEFTRAFATRMKTYRKIKSAA